MAKRNAWADEIDQLVILEGAVENTNEAFVTIDQKHTVILFNQAAERMFGYTRAEVIGRDLSSILSPACKVNHRRAVARYLKTREPRLIGHETEFVTARKSGETFPASISFSVSEVHGRLFFTGIIRDMTETKALQEQVSRAERLATLGQVIAEISHEIKNPLVMIGGFARQLIRTAPDEKALSKLNIIAAEVQRLENLLTEMRDLYVRKAVRFERVDIGELLQEVYSLARADCEGKSIHVTLTTSEENVCVEGDPDKLKQVFLNLVKNGMEALEGGGNLSIQSRLSGDRVEITIADDGPGIPESIREKIFSPFFTTKKQGTGLGLPVSKRIIEDHPGSFFTLTSEEGKGTTVKITLWVSRPHVNAKST